VGDEDQVVRGNVLCHRESMMPVTEIFEAEIDVLDLLDYKPILSKGYGCIMHIHTYNDEVVVKEILKTQEKTDKGEDIIKIKPLFAKSQTKMWCRITPKNPLALEKFETIQQMGRFTLRDEGKTICVGKVLKYKPYNKGIVGANNAAKAKAAVSGVTNQMASVTVNQAPDMVYDMDSGELKPAQPKLEGIAEEAE